MTEKNSLPPTKFERRFIASRWVNVCSQCERPLRRDRKGRRVLGPSRFFCTEYCRLRYLEHSDNVPAPEPVCDVGDSRRPRQRQTPL